MSVGDEGRVEDKAAGSGMYLAVLSGLDDWLDSTHVPLDVAQAMNDDELGKAVGWLAGHDRYGDHVWRAVGAALLHRRSKAMTGPPTPRWP